ncbi:MAG: hypothetical protein ACOZCO_13855 [Bacteroidota bacterium]
MKNHCYLAFMPALAVLLHSCYSENKEGKDENQEKNEPEAQLIIGDPAPFSSDSLVIFPVGMANYVPDETEKPDENTTTLKSGLGLTNKVTSAANGAVSYNYNITLANTDFNNEYGTYSVFTNDKTEVVDIRNLIFYNKYTGESRKLLDEKLHIISFSIHHEFGKSVIMYDVVKNDYNEDKKFDRNDPVMLFISDLQGNNFIQLTPEDENYLTYFYYKESGRMLIKVCKDGDGNKKFDLYDQTLFREVDMKKPSLGKTLFGESMIEDLKKQL